MPRRNSYAPNALLLLVVLVLALGCGGGGGQGDKPGSQVVSLSIASSAPTVAKGRSMQFTATATFTDSTRRDVTSQAVWTSSDPAKAEVNSNGLVTTRAEGTTTISAAFSGASASSVLTVTPPELVSLAVTPQSRSLQPAATQQFTVNGKFTDGSVVNVTSAASWSSSNQAVAAIDRGGKLTVLATGGPVTVTATQAGLSTTATVSVVEPGSELVPLISRVVVVVLENTNYDHMVGNPVMPFLNSLIPKGASARNFYANTHPSIDNYFMLTTGQFLAGGNDFFCGTLDVDNLVRRLLALGRTWKSYAENLPDNWMDVCLTGGLYVNRHNPFTYFSDVRDSADQRSRVVPLSQFANDQAQGALPNFSYLLPNQLHNVHDCSVASCTLNDRLAAADAWLASTIPPILSDAQFQQDGLLIITMDEAEDTDSTHGGGKILTFFLGAKVKAGYASPSFYQHQSVLKTILRALGGNSFPGAAAEAPEMGDFFE